MLSIDGSTVTVPKNTLVCSNKNIVSKMNESFYLVIRSKIEIEELMH